jgi:7-carboxy-7-deazaguanine synthase
MTIEHDKHYKVIKAKISETFVGVQGEGQNCGKPSIFIRFFGCNCKCFYCDSQYATSGEDYKIYTYKQLAIEYKDSSVRHFVFTGGEPLLQQDFIVKFIKEIKNYNKRGTKFTFEIETNGTVFMGYELKQLIEYVNISVKLNSSKQLNDVLRVNLNSLNSIILNNDNNVSFKFVITKKHFRDDIAEALEIRNIFLHTKMYLMPEGTSHDDILQGMKRLIPYCIKFNLLLSPRLQVILFGKKRGV